MTDQWVGSSDIFTDYDGTIVDAVFKSNEYGTQMVLTFDEIDGRDEPVYEYYKIPDAYESQDGGETVERVDGKVKSMSKNSKWMRFVMAAGALPGAREALGDDAPTNALRWIGSRWHMEAEPGKPYKVKDRETRKVQEGVSKDINFPTAFLGKDNVDTPASNGNGKVDSLSVLTDLHNPVLESQIQDLAKNLSQGEWFGSAYKLITESGVDPNSVPDLIAAMGGRDLYASLGGKG